ncbi:DinB family protein [Jannaschia sp. R86511]|uniref:DinB family protein n=1 Tax=Jannaschia sp. R86511 TaxID=3093853 RepID=UPI0036D37568
MSGVPTTEVVLLRYLQAGREAALWKLEGVSEHDARRPLTPTGTNLLGVVKHLAGTEAGYLGSVFGRPFPEPLPWMSDDAEPNSDMYAAASESREDVVGLYRRVWAASDVTVAALDLDALGHVPWWPPEANPVTLHRVLIHLIAETHRHAGHLDILREELDGTAGMRAEAPNLPGGDAEWWAAYWRRVSEAADRYRADPTHP